MTFRTWCMLAVTAGCSCNGNLEHTQPVYEKITEAVYASGIVKACNQYQVFSTVSGNISKIFVTENDIVKAGDPLLLVADETVTLNRKNAALAAGYAAMDANREKLTDLQNSILLAQSKCSTDSLNFIRQQHLWSQEIGSRFELEQKELAYKNAVTALASAKIKYNDLLRQLRLAARQSENEFAISRSREGDCIIKTNINGKVYFLSKKTGEIVNPQTVLAIIGDANHFLLELQVDEFDIVKIRLGQQVLVTMDSYKGQVFEAKISKIDPLMNQHTRSFSVEAVFVKQPPELYPNLTVEANIIIQTKDRALTIPRSFLINDSLVLVKGHKLKAVVTGLKDYQKAEILKGLAAQDIIYKKS